MPRFAQAVFRRERLPDLAAVASGAVTAFALPPWGWWPLAFVGLVGLDRLIADRPPAARFRRGAAGRPGAVRARRWPG